MGLQSLIIGGIIPSILLGTGTVLMKLSLKNGISLSVYLMIVGFVVFFYGTVATYITGTKELSFQSSLYAICMGLSWATAIFCMSYGISVLKMPVSIIAPLTNSNALVAVVLSSIIFSEWQHLSLPKLIFGTVFIVVGATIVSTSVTAN
jgi:transporter family protein